MAKIGRNKPCPCGSGQKYKHCHGRNVAVPEAPADGRPFVSMRAEIEQLRQKGVRVQGSHIRDILARKREAEQKLRQTHGSDEKHNSTCPLAAVDRRLEDAHQQWHQAEKPYFDPEQFRIAIQTVIQTLRTVTFILQKHKEQISDFDAWYAGWQQRLGADPLMRWMVDARNKIEKEGDLEAHSFVRAEIIASYLNEGPQVDVPANLFDTPAMLLSAIPRGKVLDHVRAHGALKIQRRWVENTLPDHELLDAVAIAYGRIAEVVHDAHRQIGLDVPTTISAVTGDRYGGGARAGRMPCMIGHGDARSLVVSLTDGQPIEFEHAQRTLGASDPEMLKERYGDIHKGIFGPPGANEEEIAASVFETARKVFLRDGHHELMFFLFSNRKLVSLQSLRPRDQRDKYLMMRGLAHEVIKHGADAVVAIGESWMAKADPKQPYMRPVDSPARREQLNGRLVRKDGVPIEFWAEIQRDGDKLELGKTNVHRDPASFMFAPIYEAWGRQIPEHWLKLIRGSYETRRHESS